MPLGVQLHFWGEALPGPLLQTPGDCAVHPIACSLGTFARFLQDMQAVEVSPSFTGTVACQLELHLLSPVQGPPCHASDSPCSAVYLHHKETEPLPIPHPCFQLIRDGCWPLQVLVLADSQPAAVLGTASLPAEHFNLAGCTSVELPVYGVAEQIAGAGGKRERIASVSLGLQVSSVAGGVLQGPFVCAPKRLFLLAALQRHAAECLR